MSMVSSMTSSSAFDTTGCAGELFALLRVDLSIAWPKSISVTNGGIYCVPPCVLFSPIALEGFTDSYLGIPFSESPDKLVGPGGFRRCA